MTVFLLYFNLPFLHMSPFLYFFSFYILLTKWIFKNHLYLYPLELLIQEVKYLYKTGSEKNLKDEKRESILINSSLQHTSLKSLSLLFNSHSLLSTIPFHSSSHSPHLLPPTSAENLFMYPPFSQLTPT